MTKNDMTNPRISVTLNGSASPFNCYVSHGWTVKRFNAPLKDSEVKMLVRMAGFYGQSARIVRREVEKVDEYNQFFVYHVDTETIKKD